MALFPGTYVFEKHENFEEFLRAAGTKEEAIKTLSAIKPTVEVAVDGDQFTIKTMNGDRRREVTFTLGEEYEETFGGGTVYKNVTTRDGNLLSTEAKSSQGEFHSTREFTEENLVLVMLHKRSEVSAKFIYKRM